MKMFSPGGILSVFIILVLIYFRVSTTAPVSLKGVTFNLTTTSITTPSPCTDFYEYACSSANEHLESTGMSSIFTEAKDYNEKLIISALSSGRARHSSASRTVSFLVELYRKWEIESKTQSKEQLTDDFDFQSSEFRYVLSRVYVDATMAATSRHYIEALRGSSTQMVAKVKASISRLLGPKDTILKETLQRVTPHVAYEDWYLNDTALDTWYGLTEANSLQFNHSASYSENLYTWKRHSRISQWSQVDPRGDFWYASVGRAIPWARSWFKRIFLPLGYLFPAVFGHASSPAATYGTLGFTTAHEFLHNLNLWENPAFKGVTQCLIEQYSAIREPTTGRHLQGDQTISEDIADNGAIKAAFDAYRDTAEGSATSDTFDRQFFLSFARQFCAIDSTEILQQKIEMGVHTIVKYRINLVLSNFGPFSQTFSCPLGSPMNPDKKCSVW